ncbi:MAG: glycosyltransferase family 2 protein [Solirubrobacteraceae bacterium]
MARDRITACMIAQNEHARLPGALASLAFCDEIVLVDGGSSDDTAAIARAHGARVIENRWPGYAKQRNVALDAASHPWILEVDADERVSPRLRASIEDALASDPRPSIAVFARRCRFLGKQLEPSAKYPAYTARLFRAGAYRHDESREVHEGIYPHERPLVLDGDLEHELAGTLSEAFGDMWRYARLESRQIEGATSSGYLAGVALRPLAKLLYRATIEGGWRDGGRGMLKIALDSLSDSLVWQLTLKRSLLGGRGWSGTPRSARTQRRHFGHRASGPAKIVAVAAAGEQARLAERWLLELSALGIDVTLITEDREEAATDVRRLATLTPLALVRAAREEMELRPFDALVLVGRRARIAGLLLPPPLRPRIAGVDAAVAPAEAARAATATILARAERPAAELRRAT